MDQQIFNIVVGLCGALMGWILKTIWGSVRDLQIADRALTKEVGEIKVLVVGTFVQRSEFVSAMREVTDLITTRLDRISDKLDQKVDK